MELERIEKQRKIETTLNTLSETVKGPDIKALTTPGISRD